MDPLLPNELERSIFLYAATLNRSMIAPLLLVAHRVQQWIEPLRFRTLAIRACQFLQVQSDSDDDLRTMGVEQRLCHAVLHKPADFVAQHVKYVLLSIDGKEFQKILPLLSSFSGLTDMAIWSDSTIHILPDLFAFNYLTYLSLNGYSAEYFCLLLLDRPESTLAITHLEFTFEAVPKLLPLIPIQLPHLSHFRLSGWWYSRTKDQLGPFTRLVDLDQMLVVVVAVLTGATIPPNVKEKYPILNHPKVTFKFLTGWEHEWNLHVEGKPDIWTNKGLLVGGATDA
ncbi:hypothetical protein DL96DRAFT_1617234 [Flagelloscypha sp. PMI_526]|nr:hypothetical protein DL96DRAFT_1617234 [Flagelloscypha sp. PMI_526]